MGRFITIHPYFRGKPVETVDLIGKVSKTSSSTYWLLYFRKKFFSNIDRVALKLLSPTEVQVIPDPEGFKVTFPSKQYDQWIISANRLVSFYLSAIPMSSREFNRLLRQNNIESLQISMDLSIDTDDNESFPKINTEALIEKLEEITGKKIQFKETVKFPVTLRKQSKFPEGVVCFYMYDFGEKGWIITMKIPPELYEYLKSSSESQKEEREKTTVEIRLDTPTTLAIVIHPGKDILKVLNYGYIEVTGAIRPFIEHELRKIKKFKKKVCIPIKSVNDKYVEISWSGLVEAIRAS